MSQTDPTPPAGANERLITDNDSVMAWGKDKRLYKVIDRADGVRGHYCVGRQMEPDSKFWEFYKDGKWCSAGEVFTDRDAAKAILNAWSNPQSNPTPPAGDAAGIPEPTDEERHNRREGAVRRACELMGWEYKTYPAYTGIRRVALAEAVAISLEKLDELLEALAAARRERDECCGGAARRAGPGAGEGEGGAMIVKACWITCDLCKAEDGPAAQHPHDLSCKTGDDARHMARKHGWRRRGGKDICPDCLTDHYVKEEMWKKHGIKT